MGYKQQERLKTIFEEARHTGETYSGNLEEINFYNIMCKAGLSKALKIWGDIHACSFKYKFNNKDSVLIIIGIPINSSKETSTSKNIAERIIDVIKDSEICFTTVDYTTSTENKNERFVYITLVKVI